MMTILSATVCFIAAMIYLWLAITDKRNIYRRLLYVGIFLSFISFFAVYAGVVVGSLDSRIVGETYLGPLVINLAMIMAGLGVAIYGLVKYQDGKNGD